MSMKCPNCQNWTPILWDNIPQKTPTCYSCRNPLPVSLIIWHRFPEEKPPKEDRYLVIIEGKTRNLLWNGSYFDEPGVFKPEFDKPPTLWADMPEVKDAGVQEKT